MTLNETKVAYINFDGHCNDLVITKEFHLEFDAHYISEFQIQLYDSSEVWMDLEFSVLEDTIKHPYDWNNHYVLCIKLDSVGVGRKKVKLRITYKKLKGEWLSFSIDNIVLKKALCDGPKEDSKHTLPLYADIYSNPEFKEYPRLALDVATEMAEHLKEIKKCMSEMKAAKEYLLERKNDKRPSILDLDLINH
ncbi:hypothetical protein O9G_003596 [Rozella allomycis CSF55]|uniref:Uncharacterized protein n=1 Tax=Rozella allomycis (strain CSF55) TaxID=988480 RepID=A0A075ATK9_ROZAC|nr:hypothetical protein O9G_003596 [Rozella allomycis CSF55]|eukprot:EPZ31887.1 hypothetical protein O9G_003596 [Rozella allomycis CSF55]